MSKNFNSGKKSRLRLKLQRSLAASMSAGAGSESEPRQVSIAEQPAHSFRLLLHTGDLATQFHTREAGFEVEKRIMAAHQPLVRKFAGLNDERVAYDWSKDGELVAIPLRADWKPGKRRMTAAQVQAEEEKNFESYLADLYSRFTPEQLNHFEHNLAVWKELWRCCDTSDCLIVTVDCRHPTFHLPPSLYSLITQTLRKPLIIVLNKVDLIPPEAVEGWKKYFQVRFPSAAVVQFSSKPKSSQAASGANAESIGELRKEFKLANQRVKSKAPPSGVELILQLLEALWKQKMAKKEANQSKSGTTNQREEILVAGTIGHPNAGKSSLLNSLFGRPVVSVSETPGHTKHIQTLILNERIHLCDCPGLVFPAVDIPKPLQVLCGIYPISQLREPYSAIQYLAERIPLETIYKLKPIDENQQEKQKQKSKSSKAALEYELESKQLELDIEISESGQQTNEAATAWSAWSICVSYAAQKNYTIKGGSGRFDTHRAANEILHDCIRGIIDFHFEPPSEEANIQPVTKEGKEAAAEEMKSESDNISRPLNPDQDTSTPAHSQPNQ